MGNCWTGRTKINLLDDIESLKVLSHNEILELQDKIHKQDTEIEVLKTRISELERRSDQLLLDYYNIEQDYYKCKNELGKSKSRIASFTNIFSL